MTCWCVDFLENARLCKEELQGCGFVVSPGGTKARVCRLNHLGAETTAIPQLCVYVWDHAPWHTGTITVQTPGHSLCGSAFISALVKEELFYITCFLLLLDPKAY